MKSELNEKLFTRFSWAESKDSHTGEGKGYLAPCWVGDGWFQLIWNMFEEIENLYKSKKMPIKVVVYELKEKYGTLRTCLESCIPEVYKITDKYEKLSEEVCENCGEKGSLIDVNGWLTVLCDTCYRKINDKKPAFIYFDAKGKVNIPEDLESQPLRMFGYYDEKGIWRNK